MELRFRPTVWPGEPVPVPRVARITEVGRDAQWLLPNVLSFDNVFAKPVEVPPEVYLRQFRDTPADDLDALAELCKLGPMNPIGPPYYEDLPIDSDEQWHNALADIEHRLWPDEPHWHGDEKERHEVGERHRLDVIPVHAAEVALRVRGMQRTTDHLLAYLAGEPVAPAWRDCEDDPAAWRNFARVTSAALQVFRVRVDVEAVGVPRQPWNLETLEVYTTLYSAAMLQLVNDLAAGETVRTCANETCRRPFVRQLGRSVYGGHRKVKTIYCSSNCARAQYQREKRRRDRAAREERQG